MLACGNRPVGFDEEIVDAEKIVAIFQLALVAIERPAAGLAALLRSAHPDWPAERSRQTLMKAARHSDAANGGGEISLP